MADFTPTERPVDERSLPSVTIDVPTKNVDEIEGLEPGDSVRVVLEGTVSEVSLRDAAAGFSGFSGTLRLEVRRMTSRKVDNAFSELMDDE